MAEKTPSATPQPRRTLAVRLELRKLRRKHLPLVALALMALELVWLGYGWSGDAVRFAWDAWIEMFHFGILSYAFMSRPAWDAWIEIFLIYLSATF